jgi:hypothetical protein
MTFSCVPFTLTGATFLDASGNVETVPLVSDNGQTIASGADVTMTDGNGDTVDALGPDGMEANVGLQSAARAMGVPAPAIRPCGPRPVDVALRRVSGACDAGDLQDSPGVNVAVGQWQLQRLQRELL